MVPKFRAWDKDEKVMRIVNEIHFTIKTITCEPLKGHDNMLEMYDPICFEGHFELMQSTGIKDKNGVEIFEGDVVKWGDTLGGEEKPIRVAVVKINPDIQFDSNVGIFQYGQFAYKNTEKFLTILGNIYENPELLEAT